MGVERNPDSRWYNYVYVPTLKKTIQFLSPTGYIEKQSAIIIQRWWRSLKKIKID